MNNTLNEISVSVDDLDERVSVLEANGIWITFTKSQKQKSKSSKNNLKIENKHFSQIVLLQSL